MLNRGYKVITCVGLLLGSVASYATPVIIQDKYWGAAPTSASYSNRDVIGSANLFDIQRMEVEFNAGFMDVVIYTHYQNGSYGTQFGDLFISTDGWHPNTAGSNYRYDNAASGEDWEFVFDNNVGLVGGDFDILLSNDFHNPSSSIFRGGQEVARGGDGYVYNDGSSVDLSHAGYNGYIRYHINLNSILGNVNSAEIGLHWTMSCGNDVIEGAVQYSRVNEPATILLFGLGLCVLLVRYMRQHIA